MSKKTMKRSPRKMLQKSPPLVPTNVPFFTRKEAAHELRMSVTKLDRVIARGELKAKRHGHAVVVMRSEIARYIEQWPDVEPRAERGAR